MLIYNINHVRQNALTSLLSYNHVKCNYNSYKAKHCTFACNVLFGTHVDGNMLLNPRTQEVTM